MCKMKQEENKTPDWYDKKKLRKAYYEYPDYTGWVIDLGDGTCRYANAPLLSKKGPQWGDRVRLVPSKTDFPIADSSKILERYNDPTEG